MNFDKNHVAHKKSIPTGTRIFRRISLTALKIFLVLLLFCVILGTAAGVGMIKGLIASAPNIDSLSVAPAESATYIYNTGNKPVQKLAESTSNRILVKLDQIPEDLQHAIVAVEDERFYKHHGIDIQGIARAAVIGITSGDFSEGASTITQQLIKNNVFTDWVTQTALSQKLRRKFQEQYLALQLEKKMSKDQILQDYLNTINLGASSYGVQAAAKRYFNKDVSQLNLSESTVIAGITQNPTLYNPIINPDENAKRRKIILQKMVDQGYISEQQQQDALADDVYSRIQKTAQETDEVSIYSYYTDALIEQVMDDLVEVKGYTRQQAYKAVYSGGLKIYSNQDEEIQKICDEEFANPEKLLRNGGSGTVFVPSHRDSVIAIPQAATYELQNRVFVYKVVDGKAKSTPVEVFRLNNGTEYIVESGLLPGDVIIAEGAGLVREGTEIETHTTTNE